MNCLAAHILPVWPIVPPHAFILDEIGSFYRYLACLCPSLSFTLHVKATVAKSYYGSAVLVAVAVGVGVLLGSGVFVGVGFGVGVPEAARVGVLLGV